MSDVRCADRPNRRRFLLAGAGGIASYGLGLSPTLSQPLHSTARILVGFPAGGPSDVTARLLAEHMKAYAATTIVENRPGAGGRVAMDVLKNSTADGSVMIVTPAVAVVLYPHVYKSLGYTLPGFRPGYYHPHHGDGAGDWSDGPQHREHCC